MPSSIFNRLNFDDNNRVEAVNVHKFGGSSLATIQRLLNVVEVIRNYTKEDDMIVVSANGNITNLLVEFLAGESSAIDKIQKYFLELAVGLVPNATDLFEFFEQSILRLQQGGLSDNEVLAYGEIWSAKLLTELLSSLRVSTAFVDAREILKSNSDHGCENFDQIYFQNGIKKNRYGNYDKRLIVTGYIAVDPSLQTITLGRNGSDYSATTIANLSGAKQVTLWTDVSGVFNADPSLIRTAKPIETLSYSEAARLASVGTNVLHQKTISPLIGSQITLNVRSSLEPAQPGTKVVSSESIHDVTVNSSCITRSVAVKNGLVRLAWIGARHAPKWNEYSRVKKVLSEHQVAFFSVDTNAKSQAGEIFIACEDLTRANQLFIENNSPVKCDANVICIVSIINCDHYEQADFIHNLSEHVHKAYRCQLLIDSFSSVIHLIGEQSLSIQLLKNVHEFCFERPLIETDSLIRQSSGKLREAIV